MHKFLTVICLLAVLLLGLCGCLEQGSVTLEASFDDGVSELSQTSSVQENTEPSVPAQTQPNASEPAATPSEAPEQGEPASPDTEIPQPENPVPDADIPEEPKTDEAAPALPDTEITPPVQPGEDTDEPEAPEEVDPLPEIPEEEEPQPDVPEAGEEDTKAPDEADPLPEVPDTEQEDTQTPEPDAQEPVNTPTAEDYTWYNSLPGLDQLEFINTFPSMEDFFDWYAAAKAAYEALHPDIEIGPGGNVDLSGSN